MKEILSQIHSIVEGPDERVTRARKIAEAVRTLGDYRWVGIYDVGTELVSIIAYSGPGAPAYPTFAVGKGLTGSAIADGKIVVVGDVRSDPRYLTAFSSTLSEIIIPVIEPRTHAVIGTIDVESETANAFGEADQKLLEECARAALRLWISR